MIALDRAPGLNRPFDMEKWGCADKAGMEALRSEARERFEAAKRTRTVEVFGSDRDERVLRLAAAHRAQAGLNGFVRLERKDLREAQVPVPARRDRDESPPTASASGDEAEARQVCAELGALLRRSEDWTLTAISSRRDFEKDFGRRCTKRRRVYNGRIECEILSFDPKSERVAKERRSPRPGPKR